MYLPKKRIFVIGSLSQADEIAKTAAYYAGDIYEVRYVRKEPEKTFEELVTQAFDNIEWADIVMVVCKPDGTIGKGTTYEVEYATRLRKQIIYKGLAGVIKFDELYNNYLDMLREKIRKQKALEK